MTSNNYFSAVVRTIIYIFILRNFKSIFINSYNRSPSWTSVEYLNRFLLGRGRVGPVAKIVPIEKLEIGDLIQLRQNPFRFNHSVIITKIENGEIMSELQPES